MSTGPRTRLVRVRKPKTCICPFCNQKQRFKLNGKYFKTVEDINLEEPVQLKVEVLRAKYLNPACSKKSFVILPKGMEKYQRATEKLVNKVRRIFLKSKSQQEAYTKRDELTKENWQIKNQHFANIIKFLNTPYFK